MNNKNNRTGSHLFFIEFLIVLFFFLIVSTVCLRLFARAHVITQRADALSHAQTAAASVAAAVENAVEDGGGYSATSAEDAIADNTPAGADNGALSAVPVEDAVADILEEAAGFLPAASLSEGQLVICYDSEFKPCGSEDAVYTLTATLGAEETISGDPNADTAAQAASDGENPTSADTVRSITPGDGESASDTAASENPATDSQEFSLSIAVCDDHRQTLLYELSATFHRPLTRKEALQ